MTTESVLYELRDIALTDSERRFLRRLEKPVLKQLNIDIMRGETLGIIGRNGAGKSSLLKIIAEVIKPSAGKILKPANTKSALLSYQLGFNHALTGRENAIYSSLLLGVSRSQAEQSLDQIFSFAGLEDYLDTPLAQYSSGMRARLGFAVALLADPDVMLIDEALGVGDHSFRKKSGEAIKRWISTNKTVVFVSHDEHAVRELCDRVLWLEHGECVFQGSAEEALDLYVTFDHWVHSLAENNPQWSEEYIRTHPLNRNPLTVLRKMRTELREDWESARSEIQQRFGGVVKTYVPTRRSPRSHIVVEDSDTAIWVENAKVIAKGTRSVITRKYNVFERIVEDMAANTQATPEQFKRTPLYRNLLECISSVE